MGLSNFIQTIFIANILDKLDKVQRFAAIANQNFAGQIQNLGDVVRFPQISDVTLKAYTKNAAIADPDVSNDAVTELKADQAYYYNVGVDDLEANQVDVLGYLAQRAAYQISDNVDTYMAGLHAGASLTVASTASPALITSLNVEDYLTQVAETMDEANVQEENRFGVIPPWFYYKLWSAGLTTKTANDIMYANGKIGMVLNFDLTMSNNIVKNSTAWDLSKIMFGIKNESYALALKVKSAEKYRPDSFIMDAIRGNFFYGAKIMRPDKTLCLTASKTAEPA